MTSFICYKSFESIFEKIMEDHESPPEYAWLIVPNDPTTAAYWVRYDGSKIRNWTGNNGRPLGLDNDPSWKIVTLPSLDPDLTVDAGL